MSASMVAAVASMTLCWAQGKTRSQGTLNTFSGSLYLAVVEATMYRPMRAPEEKCTQYVRKRMGGGEGQGNGEKWGEGCGTEG